jgi:hypothetical protein
MFVFYLVFAPWVARAQVVKRDWAYGVGKVLSGEQTTNKQSVKVLGRTRKKTQVPPGTDMRELFSNTRSKVSR